MDKAMREWYNSLTDEQRDSIGTAIIERGMNTQEVEVYLRSLMERYHDNN